MFQKLFLWLCFIVAIAYANDLRDLAEFEEEYTRLQIADPLQNLNQSITNFNWFFYDYLLRPLAIGYNHAIPLGFRMGLDNFFNNLESPVRFVGHLLVLEIKEAINDLGRFTLNSTFGLFGFLDLASQNGLYYKDINTGIVLAKWGVGDGFYLVLPILGPSSLRDSIGLAFDLALKPTSYLRPSIYSFLSSSYAIFNHTSFQIDAIDSIRKENSNTYLFLRNFYHQSQEALIYQYKEKK